MHVVRKDKWGNMKGLRKITKKSLLIVAMLVNISIYSGCEIDPYFLLPPENDQSESLELQVTEPIVLEPEMIEAEGEASEVTDSANPEFENESENTGHEDIMPEGVETEPEETDIQSTTITISAVGDVTLGTHQEQEYDYSFRQVYDRASDDSYFFENVYDIFATDDMTLINLEGPLTLSEEMNGERTYYIKGDPKYAGILTRGSVEAVSLANNHRLDFGENGSRDTIEALENENIVYAYDNQVGIYETKGIKIGFVSVNEASMETYVEKIMESGIAKLKEDGADLIIASCHWGTEREYYPEEYQRTFGRLCIDWGADLVIGHHPHVLQGVEEYQGKYIVYSLGNFCFGANRNPPDKDTLIFTQSFTFKEGEKQADTLVRIIPCSVSSVSNINDFKPTPATGEEAKRIIDKVNELSQNLGVVFDGEGFIRQKG